ncbi:MAG TPA: glycoside hydrolase family 15, partial [Streptosporangiaceae bacterium]
LLMEGIAAPPCFPRLVLAVPGDVNGQYQAGSNVLRVGKGFYQRHDLPALATPAGLACARESARVSQRWLSSGIVPGRGALMRSMAARALLDLRLLTRPNGAVAAGWHSIWKYAWPRDASWVAVALADTGHTSDAWRILQFLQRAQLSDGTWAARYLLDGSGPVRDGRPDELDAVGWVPWAVWSWFQAQRADQVVLQQLAQLWPMVSAAADAAARALSPNGLPQASMDYWEHSAQVTLGTAAALLAGLRAAADIASTLGADPSALRWGTAAASLARAITSAFGRYGYHRLPYQKTGADAAVTFLGPPFESASLPVERAVRSAEQALTLPSGGVLPGADWPGNATVAWTAETAFFALFSASTGRHHQAHAILSWLAAHRTPLGALPEQVNAQGRPVSVAPLAWTDAVVLLALLAQHHPLAVPPPP